MQLCEKYRPRSWDTFIGQDKIIRRVRALIGRPGFGDGGGDAFWFSGPTGTGKTTLAHLVAAELGCDGWGVEEIDGERCRVERVRQIGDNIGLAVLGTSGCGWRVYIVNESHAMSSRAVQAWLTLLERLPHKRLVIFTTTEKPTKDLFGKYTAPLLARCKRFEFTNQGLAQAFADRAQEIAEAEGLNGQAPARYLRLVQDCKNSMREVLQRVDAGEMME